MVRRKLEAPRSKTMVVLAKDAIIEYRNRGDLLIEPFIEENAGDSSYDVVLGKWYYRERQVERLNHPYNKLSLDQVSPTALNLGPDANTTQDVALMVGKSSGILNPYDKESVAAMWDGPFEALPLEEDLPGIKKGTPVIVIGPGENILAHTHEFIGATDRVHTTMMKARSSMGRNRIAVCACAGFGNIGFFSRWAMEIYNFSSCRHTILVPGRRIAQIVFMATTGLSTPSDMYFNKGKYQDFMDARDMKFVDLEKKWKPSDMLPKLYLDYELK